MSKELPSNTDEHQDHTQQIKRLDAVINVLTAREQSLIQKKHRLEHVVRQLEREE